MNNDEIYSAFTKFLLSHCVYVAAATHTLYYHKNEAPVRTTYPSFEAYVREGITRSPSSLLFYAFNWENTSQGHEYWYNLHEKWTLLLKNEKVKPAEYKSIW